MRALGFWFLGILTLALFAVFIYPTPYVYMVDGPMVFRTSRLTGKAEVSSSEGWKPLNTPVVSIAPQGAGIPKPAPSIRNQRRGAK